MTSYRRKRLGEILTAKGLVTAVRINEALERSDNREKRIGEILLAEGLITEESLAQALAEQRGLQFVNLTDYRISPSFFETIPVEVMQRYQFVPLEDAGEVITVAMADPNNIPAIDELEMLLQRQIEISVASPSAIADALKRSGSSEHVLQSVSEDVKFSLVKEQEDGAEEVFGAWYLVLIPNLKQAKTKIKKP